MSVTPSQTVGPFFDVLLRSRTACRMADPKAPGAIVVHGRLRDGEGMPVPDALVEIWQADRHGHYAHPDDPDSGSADPEFSGYGWCHTGSDGDFRFSTVKPGAVRDPEGRMQAPHILVSVTARGVLARYVTRLYFADEAANAGDLVLGLVPEGRRDTLIARVSDPVSYQFDISLQGASETVFFDV